LANTNKHVKYLYHNVKRNVNDLNYFIHKYSMDEAITINSEPLTETFISTILLDREVRKPVPKNPLRARFKVSIVLVEYGLTLLKIGESFVRFEGSAHVCS